MSTKIQLEFLFEAIERNNRFSKESFQPLVNVFKTRSSGLLEFIKSTQFNKQHARRLFSSLLPLVDFVLDNEKYIPASVLTEDDRQNETTTEIVPDEESSQAMLFIKFTAMMLNAYLDNIVLRRGKEQKNKSSTRRDEDILEEVYFLTEKLHGILFELDSFGPEGLQVQKSISSLCEAYWDGHFKGKESVVPQLIPVLVLRTVEDGATKADLKRLWQIKDALFLLDFTQDTISDLKTVILRTLSCPLYVKTVEGRKMIAFFFQLDALLVKDLHKSMKAQLPLAKGSTLEAYGEIYFRAWKEAASLNSNQVEVDDCDSDDDFSSNNETIQRIIEDNVLQDLMNASLHVASPHMSKTIRCILEPFHSKKSSPEIEKLLFRMYSPIIWRALSAANPMVRINATAIMAQIFPLRDPDAGKLHIQEVHEKTVNVLLNLMRDSDPKVRVAGCDAAVNVLGVYWDALSSQHIRALIHEIVAKHAKDAASSAVRAQAVQGVTLLLDAEASHGVLRPLLPFMGDLIHDKVEKVRLATVKLLLKLKTLKGFKYYHVAPSHHILSRLAAEGEGLRNPTGPVAAALTDLLCNSYCPLGVKNSEQMRRTITFLTEAPKAAYVFYSNLSKFYDVASISKFIVMLMKTLQIHVHQNCEDDGEPDILLFSAMAQTVLTLWTSISKDLEKSENESFLEFVQAAMKGNTLPDMCVYFEKLSVEHADDKKIVNECHKVCASLLHCAGFMSPSSRDELTKTLSEKIQKYCDLETHERNDMNILPYIAVFCSWGLQETVADSLCKAISSAFDDEHSGTSFEVKSKLSRKRKPVSEADGVNGAEFSETIRRMPSDVAIYIVDQVLTGSHSSNMLVRDAFLSSEIISDKISSSLFKATASAEKIMNGSIISLHSDHHVKLVLSACETYTRFAIHKEATSDGPLKLNQQLVSLLIWLTDRAVPVICAKRGRSSCSPFKDVDLSVIGGRDSMSPVPSSPIAVPPPRRRSNMTESTNMDSTFDIMEPHTSEIIFDHMESSVSVYAMAVHLVRSALVLFSEWIVLGGSGSDIIAEHAKAWSKIFSCSFSNIDIPAEIFPSYCRLCTIIASYSLDFSLVEDAIQIAQEFNEEELNVALQYVRKSLMYFFPKHKDKKNAELPASLQRVLNESV